MKYTGHRVARSVLQVLQVNFFLLGNYRYEVFLNISSHIPHTRVQCSKKIEYISLSALFQVQDSLAPLTSVLLLLPIRATKIFENIG